MKQMKTFRSDLSTSSGRSLPFSRFCYWSVPLLPIRRGEVQVPPDRVVSLPQRAELRAPENALEPREYGRDWPTLGR